MMMMMNTKTMTTMKIIIKKDSDITCSCIFCLLLRVKHKS